MRITIGLWVAASLLRVCRHEEAPVASDVAVTSTPHGGVLTRVGALRTELVAQPEGRLLAYVTDARDTPVRARRVTAAVRRPDGSSVPVAMRLDPAMNAYVGRVAGMPEGAYPIELTVTPVGQAAPVQFVSSPVRVTPVALPIAHHGGRVQLVGDRAVEVVVGNSGALALFWMNLDGAPIPATEVTVPSARVRVGNAVRVVPLHAQGAYLVGQVALGAPAEIAVELPSVEIAGAVYAGVAVEALSPVAVIPGVVVVAPAPSPAVVVAPIYVEQPAIVLVPGGHVPHGRAHGWWSNRGVIVGAPHGGHEGRGGFGHGGRGRGH